MIRKAPLPLRSRLTSLIRRHTDMYLLIWNTEEGPLFVWHSCQKCIVLREYYTNPNSGTFSKFLTGIFQRNPGHESKVKPKVVPDWRSKEIQQVHATLNPGLDAGREPVIRGQSQTKSTVYLLVFTVQCILFVSIIVL